VRWPRLCILISGLANKKGRGETAPTFLTSLLIPVPVHPWSKAESDCGKLRAADTFQRSSAMPMRGI